MAFVVRPGEEFTFRQEIYFDEYLYGSTDGVQNGVIIIQRSADEFYWNGSEFDAVYVEISTTDNGTSHEYTFMFPNTEDVFFNVTMRVNDDPITESSFSVVTRVSGGDGGGGGGPAGERVFDAVGFVTGFGTTVG